MAYVLTMAEFANFGRADLAATVQSDPTNRKRQP
jgi:hypothetical protein